MNVRFIIKFGGSSVGVFFCFNEKKSEKCDIVKRPLKRRLEAYNTARDPSMKLKRV